MKGSSPFFRLAVLAALTTFAAPAFVARAESPGVIVGIDALRSEIAVAPLAAQRVVLFSPDDHLADVFIPLGREGKIDAVSVVFPATGPMSDGNLAAWKSYAAGLAPGADNSFALRGGALEGRIGKLSVRVETVSGWRGGAAGLAILDLAFLLAMYEDEVRTPFVDLPRKFMATLEDRKVESSRVRVWTAGPGGIPLANGYLPKLAAEVVGDPAAFREKPPAKWEELRQGEYLAFFGAYEEAVPHFENYLREEPEDPAVLFRLAQISFVDREIERGIRFLRRAYKKDASYIRGYSESAFTFFRKRELENAERVIRAGLIMEPSSPDLKRGLAHVLLGQAEKLLATDPGAAERRFSEVGGIGLPDAFVAELRGQWTAAKSHPAPPPDPPEGMPREPPRFQTGN